MIFNLFDLEDNQITQLTDTSLSEVFPDWSPDGTQILFTVQMRDSEGVVSFNLYTVSVDGSDHQKLIENGRNAIWSPDDMHIALIRDGDIYVADTDGSSMRRITTAGDLS